MKTPYIHNTIVIYKLRLAVFPTGSPRCTFTSTPRIRTPRRSRPRRRGGDKRTGGRVPAGGAMSVSLPQPPPAAPRPGTAPPRPQPRAASRGGGCPSPGGRGWSAGPGGRSRPGAPPSCCGSSWPRGRPGCPAQPRSGRRHPEMAAASPRPHGGMGRARPGSGRRPQAPPGHDHSGAQGHRGTATPGHGTPHGGTGTPGHRDRAQERPPGLTTARLHWKNIVSILHNLLVSS